MEVQELVRIREHEFSVPDINAYFLKYHQQLKHNSHPAESILWTLTIENIYFPYFIPNMQLNSFILYTQKYLPETERITSFMCFYNSQFYAADARPRKQWCLTTRWTNLFSSLEFIIKTHTYIKTAVANIYFSIHWSFCFWLHTRRQKSLLS